MRVPDADRRAVVAVAPGHVVAVFQPRYTWVVGVLELLLDLADARIGRHPRDGLVLDAPIHTVATSAGVEVHLAGGVVDAKDARKAVAKGDYGRIEDAVRARDLVPLDDRVAARAPQNRRRVSGTVLPGDVWECACGRCTK